jgi:hypothetical protein
MPPFSERVRVEIDTRAGNISELSGRNDRPLERMHFVHGKGDKNCAKNALKVTQVEHLAYHIYFRDNPEEIGLKQRQNDWSIDAINQRAVTALHTMGKIGEYDDELADALLRWEQILANS